MPPNQLAPATRTPTTPAEETVCYGLAVIVGLIPVVPTIVRHARFDATPSIGLGMAVAGLAGLIAAGWARRRRPGAIV